MIQHRKDQTHEASQMGRGGTPAPISGGKLRVPMFNIPELRERLGAGLLEDRTGNVHNVIEHIAAIEHDVDVVMRVIEKWLLESFNRGDVNG